MNRSDQENLIRYITKKKGSRIESYDRHMYYFNVTRSGDVQYGLDRPILFNIIRNPVSRYISHFYFSRDPIKWKRSRTRKRMSLPPKSWFEKDLNTCLKENDPECYFVPGKMREMVLTYFCGQHPACM
ncbi:uronyl 2-sulfotransferase-like [Oratosquilla oratoria]|uniref:uronyl 2-sulfotransferase-like n=1 Tax=Oratosquilla oratoria TaxID=337810 RepID=UPI003F76AD6A